MPITIDSHIHTRHSPDGISTMEQHIKKALSLGLSGLCFTEHTDVMSPEPGFNPGTDLSAYREEFLRMKERYGKDIALRFGLESGLLSWGIEETREYVRGYAFDYVIASLHWLERFPNMVFPENWRYYQPGDIMGPYAAQLLEHITAYGDFDCIGHLTYFGRYCPHRDLPLMGYKDAPDELDALFRYLIQHGKGLEINTSTQPALGFTMPEWDILSRYRELGGEIVAIGSDAHEDVQLARGFDYAEALLTKAGFSHYTIFEERSPRFLPLLD